MANEMEVRTGKVPICSATGERCFCFERGGRCRNAYKSPKEKVDLTTKRYLNCAELILNEANSWLELAVAGPDRSYPNPEIRDAITQVNKVRKALRMIK